MMAAGLGRGLGVFAKDYGTEADLRQAIELLVERNVDVNASTDDGITAIHLAAQAGLDSVVTVLAKHGARLDVKDKRGRTPGRHGNGRRRPRPRRWPAAGVRAHRETAEGTGRAIVAGTRRAGALARPPRRLKLRSHDVRAHPFESIQSSPASRSMSLLSSPLHRACGLIATPAPQRAQPIKTGEVPQRKKIAPIPKRGTFVPPKTPWGDPDITGDYNNSDESGIPFERPDEFAGRPSTPSRRPSWRRWSSNVSNRRSSALRG